MNINELQKLAIGDPKAEKQLFELLTARFRSIAQRNIWDKADYEEAVQDALTAVFKKYKTTTYDTSFSAWAYGVLHKVMVFYNTERLHQRERFADPGEGDDFDAGYEPDPLLEAQLLECFRKLSHKNNMYARIINYSYQGYQVPEICRKLKLTRTNFYSILSRSRALLRQCLEKGRVL